MLGRLSSLIRYIYSLAEATKFRNLSVLTSWIIVFICVNLASWIEKSLNSLPSLIKVTIVRNSSISDKTNILFRARFCQVTACWSLLASTLPRHGAVYRFFVLFKYSIKLSCWYTFLFCSTVTLWRMTLIAFNSADHSFFWFLLHCLFSAQHSESFFLSLAWFGVSITLQFLKFCRGLSMSSSSESDDESWES